MSRSDPYRVLVVEDHGIMRSVLIRLLEREVDLTVCGEAASAEDALVQVRSCNPDLALVDISLPGMSGIRLIKQLQDDYPDVVSLVVSGHKESIYGQEALRAGARGYVEKTNAHAIIEAVRHVLDGGVYFRGRAIVDGAVDDLFSGPSGS